MSWNRLHIVLGSISTVIVVQLAVPLSPASAAEGSMVQEIRALDNLIRNEVVHDLVENAKHTCMSTSGFVYEQRTAVRQSLPRLSDGSVDQDEFRRLYGWGVSQRPPAEVAKDPNAERMNWLSEVERAAFNRAFLTCTRTINTDLLHLDEVQRIHLDLDAAIGRVDEEPVVRREAQKWSKCVLEAGFPDFQNEAEVFRWIVARFERGVSNVAADEVRLAMRSKFCADRSFQQRTKMRAEIVLRYESTHIPQRKRINELYSELLERTASRAKPS